MLKNRNQRNKIENRLSYLKDVITILYIQHLRNEGCPDEFIKEEAERLSKEQAIEDRFMLIIHTFKVLFNKRMEDKGSKEYILDLNTENDIVYKGAIKKYFEGLNDNVFVKDYMKKRIKGTEYFLVVTLCQQFVKDHGCFFKYAKECVTQLKLPLLSNAPEGATPLCCPLHTKCAKKFVPRAASTHGDGLQDAILEGCEGASSWCPLSPMHHDKK